MLRDYNNTELTDDGWEEELQRCLEDFAIESATVQDVPFFTELSPDSFVWRVNTSDDNSYYLYAEDYVTDLDTIRRNIESVSTGILKGNFVKTKQPISFEEAEPVKNASTYNKPENFDNDLAPYATDSGFDFVFLYQIER